jgi:hypothetical protein
MARAVVAWFCRYRLPDCLHALFDQRCDAAEGAALGGADLREALTLTPGAEYPEPARVQFADLPIDAALVGCAVASVEHVQLLHGEPAEGLTRR